MIPCDVLYRSPVVIGPLLGGSWVVISGVIGPLIYVINMVTLLITLFITTHEPPSMEAFSWLVRFERMWMKSSASKRSSDEVCCVRVFLRRLRRVATECVILRV